MGTAVSQKTALAYRPDIDGLRAIAVLSVLAYHIDIKQLSGGYVGVDIFFVISGYLISSIIFADISASRFSVIAFYERRIRRILPGLFGMLAAFSVLAIIYLFPSELVECAQSMLATTASLSNLYFWQHSGYFDAPLSQPLLHTWSLAVEEQFYIFFPLALVLIRRWSPRHLRTSVVILFLISLLVSALVVAQNQQTAFYMPYTRAWELLLGTILSLRILPILKWPWQRNLATLAGMGLIIFSIVCYTQYTPFPGISALAPCMGSALIIGAGEYGSSWVGTLLSRWPMVFIGLISYSLYLWHWPIIVLQKMGVLVGLNAISPLRLPEFLTVRRFDMLIEIGLSLILATLFWVFVERPFRSGRLRFSGPPLFKLTSVVMIILMGLAFGIILTGGFTARYSPDAVALASGADWDAENRSMRTGSCFITTNYHFKDYDADICLRQREGKKNYLLIGDSHSAMLWSALSFSLQDANVMQASNNDCAPVLHPSGSADCRKLMAYIFQSYLPTHRIDGLLMVARWLEKDMDELTATIAWANQHQLPISVFGPMPEYDGPLRRLLAYSVAWNKPKLAAAHLVPNGQYLDAKMRDMALNTWHVNYISLFKEICGAEGCAEYADAARKIPLMDDANHLNRFGASVIVGNLVAKGELN